MNTERLTLHRDYELELTGDAVVYSWEAYINVCAPKSAMLNEHLTDEAQEWFMEQNIEAKVIDVFMRKWADGRRQKFVILKFENANDVLLCKMRWL